MSASMIDFTFFIFLIWTTLITGFTSSFTHVISGPDHLAAVTPLAIDSNKNAGWIGVLWGTGHILGMGIIGILFSIFREMIPIEAIASVSEQMVAFVLIGVGIWALVNHNSTTARVSKSIELKRLGRFAIKSNFFVSLAIGFIHGLAGVVHFALLLPALVLDTKLESVSYFFGFIIGTIGAMALYSLLIGRVVHSSHRKIVLIKVIRIVGALFAILVGIYWLQLSF